MIDYALYDTGSRVIDPARYWCRFTAAAMRNPFLPLSHTPLGRAARAAAAVYGSLLRERGKPA